MLKDSCPGVSILLQDEELLINVEQFNMEHESSLSICQDCNELLGWHIFTVKYSAATKNEWTSQDSCSSL
jgi:hypothetical protein